MAFDWKAHEKLLGKIKANFWRRSIISIEEQQLASRRDPGAIGPLLVSRVDIPAPVEDDTRRALQQAIEDLKENGEQYTTPNVVTVHAEWVGPRFGVDKKAVEPAGLSEQEKYEKITASCDSNGPTIFYLHGGGFYLGSPIMARPTTSTLAKISKGRCFAVQYRYATDAPFPSALLDVFIAYLSLLSPPAGAIHKPVKASSIILAGESAGLNLCLALTQVLLQCRQNGTQSVQFHGREVKLQMPAAIAGLSGFVDLTLALPSWTKNSQFDYMPEEQPNHTAAWTPERIWPANPPRGDIYCETSILCHPLVSPTAANSWKGAPQMWIACGDERPADGCKAIVQQAARDGVAVEFEQYAMMPHDWPIVLPNYASSKRCLERWAGACVRASNGHTFNTSAERVHPDTLATEQLDVKLLLDMSHSEVLRRMHKRRRERRTYKPSELKGSYSKL